MASAIPPLNPQQIITPAMYASARRSLGAIHQGLNRIAVFEGTGKEYPDQKEMFENMRLKAEGLIAAYEMQYPNGDAPNG